MADQDSNRPPDRNRKPNESLDDEIIPGRHGKHGGSLESEGSPQEPSSEANEQPKYNGADKNRH